ncbi:hypothetical protein HUT03_05305 [Candidatus Liberibacter africanus]|uniref:Uncharacterized protein n=1 Tax=Candidatus Liberibacter africanus PTSAPSY TaxID=1277257 RepID=A0A0G3I5V9_LIBAF|nr:hypothetical protein [Candidatus Liberibacter africanus]AKK20655.1 hypothetical protein G293_05220 [Candidatus Liberibacter africanus PTSAPSY]QTP64330.1 hypothetical protein HUT03_05305 [Candidatus Liberibacter africanus]
MKINLLDILKISKQKRTRHESNWWKISGVSMLFLPFHQEIDNDFPSDLNVGDILDPTFSSCCSKYAAIIEEIVTPHDRKWHTLFPISKELYEK